MNVLFISAILPYPLHSGGQIRIYNLLKRLSKRHKITLLSFIRDKKEQEHVKDLSFLHHVETVYRGRALQIKYLFGALGKYSWLLSTYNNSEMKQMVNDQLTQDNFDLVHIEPFYVYPSLPALSIPLVVGEHNVEYSIYEQYVRRFPLSFLRPFLFLDVVKTRIWEETIWKKAKEVIAVSEQDRAVMQKIRAEEITVVPNGVDCKMYSYKKRTGDGTSLRCLFVGDFAWVPNREAIRRLLIDIWPAIIQAYPEALLTIAGKQFPNSLRRYLTKNMTRVEYVSDIRAVYDSHAILLAPMGISGGTKFKLLEAFASGMVVLTSREGYAGIRAEPGKDLFEVDTPQDYVRALRFMTSHRKEISVMTSRARELIEKQYNWDAIAAKLEDVWQRVIT